MVVDFVKSFGKVYGTQVRGTTAMNVAIDNISHCLDSIATSDSFLKAYSWLSEVLKNELNLSSIQCSKIFDRIGLIAMALKSLQVNDLL